MESKSIKERPILFSGAMIRALLDGTKTVTRRIVKPQPDAVEIAQWASGPNAGKDYDILRCYNNPERFKHSASGWSVSCPGPFNIPGKPGDRLWVRETWRLTGGGSAGVSVVYRAEEEARRDDFQEAYRALGLDELGRKFIEDDDRTKFDRYGCNWRPSIHMPRWASRITLEVVSVRVERLQDISEEDAKAEGTTAPEECLIRKCPRTYRDAYRKLWESINGAGSWEANPWVWVITFKRIEQPKP